MKTSGWQSLLSIIWQAGRYTFAAFVSFFAGVLGPFITFACAFVLLGLLTLLLSLGFFVSFITMSADSSMQAIIGAVGLPLMFFVGTLVALLVIGLAGGLCALLIALPLAALTEAVLQKNKSALARLAFYWLESVVVGGAAAALWLWLRPLQLEMLWVIVLAALLFSVTSGSVGGFGLALTVTEQARRFVVWLLGRRPKNHAASLPMLIKKC